MKCDDLRIYLSQLPVEELRKIFQVYSHLNHDDLCFKILTTAPVKYRIPLVYLLDYDMIGSDVHWFEGYEAEALALHKEDFLKLLAEYDMSVEEGTDNESILELINFLIEEHNPDLSFLTKDYKKAFVVNEEQAYKMLPEVLRHLPEYSPVPGTPSIDTEHAKAFIENRVIGRVAGGFSTLGHIDQSFHTSIVAYVAEAHPEVFKDFRDDNAAEIWSIARGYPKFKLLDKISEEVDELIQGKMGRHDLSHWILGEVVTPEMNKVKQYLKELGFEIGGEEYDEEAIIEWAKELAPEDEDFLEYVGVEALSDADMLKLREEMAREALHKITAKTAAKKWKPKEEKPKTIEKSPPLREDAKAQAAYIQSKGHTCPKCGKKTCIPDGEPVHEDIATVTQNTRCDSCGATWSDKYGPEFIPVRCHDCGCRVTDPGYIQDTIVNYTLACCAVSFTCSDCGEDFDVKYHLIGFTDLSGRTSDRESAKKWKPKEDKSQKPRMVGPGESSKEPEVQTIAIPGKAGKKEIEVKKYFGYVEIVGFSGAPKNANELFDFLDSAMYHTKTKRVTLDDQVYYHWSNLIDELIENDKLDWTMIGPKKAYTYPPEEEDTPQIHDCGFDLTQPSSVIREYSDKEENNLESITVLGHYDSNLDFEHDGKPSPGEIDQWIQDTCFHCGRVIDHA